MLVSLLFRVRFLCIYYFHLVVNIMTSRASVRREIDVFIFELRVAGFLFSVTLEADFILLLFFLDRVEFSMYQVAP